ncbi:MAG: hypothetical protein L0219_14665 [Phycisphaerales bacterium]|nr:hypothetical protein [Phycisphaerales bacterium]
MRQVRSTSSDHSQSGQKLGLADERRIARRVGEALDRAMELGLWEHAERVAASAMRLAPQHAVVAERLARLRAAQGDFQAALAIVDSCASRPASLRLLRAVCLLQLGRRLEAHLDLREWSRAASAPLQARLLLALLEWLEGDQRSAIDALLRNLKQFQDPRSLTALMLIAAAEDRPKLAAYWAQRLRVVCAWNRGTPDIDIVMRSLEMDGFDRSAILPTEAQVQTLATELLGNEMVVPALVEAQRRIKDQMDQDLVNPKARSAPGALLLKRAIEKTLDDLADRATGYVALAQVCLLEEDSKGALEWAARGLREFPLSANLARLASQLGAEQAEKSQPDGVLAIIGDGRRAEGRVPQERAA